MDALKFPLDFAAFDAVLLDLDGTIYHEDHALPGAADLVRRLQASGRPFACLSNSTSSPQRIGGRLRRMGMEIAERNIYTAGAAAADYVLRQFPRRAGAPDAAGGAAGGGAAPRKPRVFNLSTEGVHDLLDGKVEWVAGGPGPAASPQVFPPCDVVVAGTPTNLFAAEDRQRTALALLRDGAALVGVCADRVFPSPRGIEFGSGAFTAMLAYASGAAAVFTGKPEPVFFHELCDRLGVAPARCLLIGDNLESDVGGGKGVGMRTVLTLTGVARRADLAAAPPQMTPDAVVEDLTRLL